MLISFVIFCISFLSIILFIIWKVPVLAKLPEEDTSKDFILVAKEKIEEGVKKEVKERFEDALQKVLSGIRKILIRIEKITTKSLYTLRRKRRKEKTINEKKTDKI